MRKFWYDGHCSAEFGLMASGSGVFGGPERDIERISIPGRNGDLIFDNKRFKNITVPYPVSICEEYTYNRFADNIESVRAWLLSGFGKYLRLYDDYNQNTYRLAAFIGPIDFDVDFFTKTGESVLYFDCKPQRFLVNGDFPMVFTVPGKIINNQPFDSDPIIMIYGSGSGTVTIGNQTVVIKSIDDQITLDSELQQAYRQVGDGAPENWNAHISAPEFPKLLAGENPISWTGDIDHIEIIPRWWTV